VGNVSLRRGGDKIPSHPEAGAHCCPAVCRQRSNPPDTHKYLLLLSLLFKLTIPKASSSNPDQILIKSRFLSPGGHIAGFWPLRISRADQMSIKSGPDHLRDLRGVLRLNPETLPKGRIPHDLAADEFEDRMLQAGADTLVGSHVCKAPRCQEDCARRIVVRLKIGRWKLIKLPQRPPPCRSPCLVLRKFASVASAQP
jgi:hypothetical protein